MPNRVPKRKRRRLLSADDVIELLQAEIEKAGTQTEWARRTGVNRSSLNLTLAGRRRLQKTLVNALGLEQVIAYAPRRKRASGS